MSKKRITRGRPRKYKDDAEKQKAFREKKKEQFQKLEERIEELEALANENLDKTVDKNQPGYNWTFQDIKEMSTKQLQQYKIEFKKILDKHSIHSPLRVIVEEVIGNSEELVTSLIRHEVLRLARNFDTTLFNSTLLHLINLELGNRMSEIDFDLEIELAEQRISELEAEIQEKKKQQVSLAKQPK